MIEIGQETQLFIDDYLLERRDNSVRHLHQPRKHEANPILRPDRPWEGPSVILYGTVLYDEPARVFKMWYQTYARHEQPPENTWICYATSMDGIVWEKPDLGLVESRRSRANNIILPHLHDSRHLDSPSLLCDPRDPEESRRYKLVVYAAPNQGRGLYAAFSPDGVHWRWREAPLLPDLGDRTNIWYQHEQRKYKVWTRLRGYSKRVVAESDSEDFEHWSPQRLVLEPDREDPSDTEFYSATAFKYQSIYLGFLEVFHVNARRLDTQLICSRDGVNWRRAADRQVFLPNGPEGKFDCWWAFPASNPPLRVGDELWIWYSGRANPHGPPPPPPPGYFSEIGLAKMPLDRFVSLDAEGQEATVTTKPLVFRTGSRLEVNADATRRSSPAAANFARQGGNVTAWLKVEVLDEAGHGIPGYSRDDCDPITGDSLAHPVTWHGRADIATLAGKPLRLQFLMYGTRLYGFRIAAS